MTALAHPIDLDDDKTPCARCGDRVYTPSTRGWCDGCEEEADLRPVVTGTAGRATRHNIVCDDCEAVVGVAWHVATTPDGHHVWLQSLADPTTHKCPPREDRQP